MGNMCAPRRLPPYSRLKCKTGLARKLEAAHAALAMALSGFTLESMPGDWMTTLRVDAIKKLSADAFGRRVRHAMTLLCRFRSGNGRCTLDQVQDLFEADGAADTDDAADRAELRELMLLRANKATARNARFLVVLGLLATDREISDARACRF